MSDAASKECSTSGVVLVLAAGLIWSTGGMAIKHVEASGPAIAAMRGLIAGLVFLPFIRPSRVRFDWRVAALFASYSLMNASFVTATKWTTAANAIALQYTAPLWIFVIEAISGVLKAGWRRLWPMVMVSCGIVFFLFEPGEGPSSLAGNLMGLLSGLGFALTILFFRVLRDQHNTTLVSLANLAAFAVLLPLVIWSGELFEMRGIGASGWGAMIYLGAVQIGLAYVIYSRGLRKVTALRASILSLAEPVLNPAWVFLTIGESPTRWGLLGAAAVLAGIALDLFLNRGAKRKIETEPPPF